MGSSVIAACRSRVFFRDSGLPFQASEVWSFRGLHCWVQECSVVGSRLDCDSAGFQCFVGAVKELAPDT